MRIRRLFTFPNPVDERSARLVAAGVVAQALFVLVVREWWTLVPLTYGFLARVAAGPRFSPLGLVVTRLVTPRLSGDPIEVPGPPKRFAQGIGLAFSAGALAAWVLGAPTVSLVLIVGLAMAASLEAFVGYCLGCMVFGRLMQWGVIPPTVCEACNDLRDRLAAATATRPVDVPVA